MEVINIKEGKRKTTGHLGYVKNSNSQRKIKQQSKSKITFAEGKKFSTILRYVIQSC